MRADLLLFQIVKPSSDIHFFFYNDTATTEIYTLSLHDALPICSGAAPPSPSSRCCRASWNSGQFMFDLGDHEIGRATSELQSQSNIVCRLLLEKKKKIIHSHIFEV